jgi:hypothetical protein
MYGMCSLHVECVECVLFILVMQNVFPLYTMYKVSLYRMYGVFSLHVEYVECVLFCAWNMAAWFHAIAAKLYVECVLFM